MTRDEAVKILQATRLMLMDEANQPISDLYYALDMAIEALEQTKPQRERIKPCPMCGCVPSIRFEIGRGWEVLCKGHNETSLCPTRDWAIQSWNELVEEQTERSE